MDREKPLRCVEEHAACAQARTACADACMSEAMVGELTTRIRANADCADICDATAAVLSRHTGYDADLTRAILPACATVCRACGDACANHADRHGHHRVRAEACRRCERVCDDLLASLG